MKTQRRLYVWLLPIAWGVCCFVAFDYPGDEYGLWGFGSIAGAWIVLVLGNVGDVKDLRLPVVATGMITIALVGLILDLLRVHRQAFGVVWIIAACIIAFSMLASYDSFDAAMSKNGSLAAYVLFATNFGLYVSVALVAPVALVLRLGRPNPGRE